MYVFLRNLTWPRMARHQSPSSSVAYQLICSGSVIGGNGWGVWLQKPLIHPWLLIRAHLITLLSEPKVVMGNFSRTLKWVQVSLLMSWRKKRSYKCTTAHRHTHTTWTHVTWRTCPPLVHVHKQLVYIQNTCSHLVTVSFSGKHFFRLLSGVFIVMVTRPVWQLILTTFSPSVPLHPPTSPPRYHCPSTDCSQ